MLVLANIAAGPLEDLLCRSPDRFLDRAEIQYRRDSKFHRCITGVWGLPEDFIDRLVQYTSMVATRG
jgi:hypothetical protein